MASEKSTRWQFTAFEQDYPLLDSHAASGHPLLAEIGWQDEIAPETLKKHRQGFLRTVRQVRFSQIKEIMGSCHLEKAKNWEALKLYCSKTASRDPSGSTIQMQWEKPMRLHEMLIAVAKKFIAVEDWFHERIPNPSNPYGPTYSLDRQTDRRHLLSLLAVHSQELIMQHPEYGIVLTRQDAREAWCTYFATWLRLAKPGECQ